MKLFKLLVALGTLTALSFNAHAAISITGVTGPITFDSLPPVTEWSTVSIAGAGGDINDTTALDAAVAALTAAGVSTVLPQSPTVPPSDNALARHNSAAFYLQTRPTGNRAAVLMATLQNDTAMTVTKLTVEYNLGVNNEITEQIAGHRIYFSLTGDASSWVPMGELATAGAVLIDADVMTWSPGAPLYLLWVDDNANPGTDGSYTIDDVTFTPSFGTELPSVTVTSPTEGQVVIQSTLLTLRAVTTGPIINVDIYVDGVLYVSDAAAPFSTTTNTTPMAPGAHTVHAIATDSSAGTHTSPTINFTITPNTPPTIAITNVFGTNVAYGGSSTGLTHLVGTPIFIQASVGDDVAVTNVDWFVDGVFHVNRPATAPGWVYHNPLVGTHTIHGIATDRGNLMTTTPTTTVTVTNPPSSIFTILLPNGDTWKYYNSMEQPPDDGGGSPWFSIGYDDSAWLDGAAEIGGGDRADGYPEATLIDIGPGANPPGRFVTIYFRKLFEVTDPSSFQNIVLNALRDDGVVVHLNGLPIYTNNMPAATPIVYATLAPGAAADEGLAYQRINIDPASLQNPLQAGLNILAVEVHQSSLTSSDLSFDLMLWGESASTQTITITSPTAGQSFFTGNNVTVDVSASTFVTNAIVSVNGTDAGSDDTLPFSVVIPAIGPAGSKTLVARGRSRIDGSEVSSAPVTISVIDGPVTTTLVATGSVWRFLDDGTEPPADWRTLGFDDTLWGSGPAELGFGDGDEATLVRQFTVPGGPGGIDGTNITIYFRRKFMASDPGDITNLVVNFRRDDGGIVYINDVEVFRSNMPMGPVDHITLSTAGTTSETAFFSATNFPNTLVHGENIIAAEVHQSGVLSSDVSFELSLISTKPPGPPRPRLTITGTGVGTADLSWAPNTAGFRLECSGSVLGPWITPANQANPQSISTTGLPKFFRLVNP